MRLGWTYLALAWLASLRSLGRKAVAIPPGATEPEAERVGV
jgi:hypothetical protein